MARIIAFLFIYSLLTTSCIRIEEEPLVIINPSISFVSIENDNDIIVNATVAANPQYVLPGNIPAIFIYTGTLTVQNANTGEIIDNVQIEGDGLSVITEVTYDGQQFSSIAIICSGTLSVYADVGNDSKSSNDILITESSFSQSISAEELLNLSDNFIVNISPELTFQDHIKGGEYFSTVTIAANPNYIGNVRYPINFEYSGVFQVFDQESGGLLKSSLINGEGLSKVVSVAYDTISYSGFVFIVSGKVDCKANIQLDTILRNDVLVTSSEFYGSREIVFE